MLQDMDSPYWKGRSSREISRDKVIYKACEMNENDSKDSVRFVKADINKFYHSYIRVVKCLRCCESIATSKLV